MDLRLYPAPLRGAVTPPPSKSLLHRQLICLAQAGEFPCPPDPADDVLATVRGLWALYHQPEPVIDCGASGSTSRSISSATARISHWARLQQRRLKKFCKLRQFIVMTIFVSQALGST